MLKLGLVLDRGCAIGIRLYGSSEGMDFRFVVESRQYGVSHSLLLVVWKIRILR